jgi:alginate production protein
MIVLNRSTIGRSRLRPASWLLLALGFFGDIRAEDMSPESHEPWLKFEGEIEITRDEQTHISFGRQSPDDANSAEQQTHLKVFYRPNRRLSALAQLDLLAEQEVRRGTRTQSGRHAERGETWLQMRRVLDSDYTLKLGRQKFTEPRLWWWDSDLDAVRVDYERSPWRATLGVAHELARTSTRDSFIEPEEEDVRRVIVHADWNVVESLHVETFFLSQRDYSAQPRIDQLLAAEQEDNSDADLSWLGVRVSANTGRHGHKLVYWTDIAAVSGRETLFDFVDDGPDTSRVDSIDRRRIRGWGIDTGAVWTLPFPDKPSIMLNYARGSGDGDFDDSTDRTFRQTRIQDTDEDFRYYGEALRPELSNISIASLALSMTIRSLNRITLGYHCFRQVDAAPFLRDSRLDASPTGTHRDIGKEANLLIEIHEWEDTEVELAAAVFEAGAAFGDSVGNRSRRLRLKLKHAF